MLCLQLDSDGVKCAYCDQSYFDTNNNMCQFPSSVQDGVASYQDQTGKPLTCQSGYFLSTQSGQCIQMSQELIFNQNCIQGTGTSLSDFKCSLCNNSKAIDK